MSLCTAHTKLIKFLPIHVHPRLAKLHLNVWQLRLQNALVVVDRFLSRAAIIVDSCLAEINLWTVIVHRSTAATHLAKARSDTRGD